jgi:D-tyrosyl-tRNA(Tyr) deacylase
MAEAMFQSFIDYARLLYPHVDHGVFGADMHLEVEHQGPFTMVLEA